MHAFYSAMDHQLFPLPVCPRLSLVNFVTPVVRDLEHLCVREVKKYKISKRSGELL